MCRWCFCFTVDARVSSKYEDFLFRGYILVAKLLRAGYSSQKRHTTFRKFYGHQTNLVHKFDTVSHMLKGLFTNCDIWLVSSYFLWIVTSATFGAGHALPEHLISLTLGSSLFHPFIIYMYKYITEFVSLRTMFTD